MNSKFIGSQQTHREKFTSNRSPRDHCIENQKRERERKPYSYYLRTRSSMVDYSRIIGEAPMKKMNPSVMVLDWILRLWNLWQLDVFFVNSPRVFWIFGYLLASEAVERGPVEGTTHQGASGAPWHTLVGCALHSPPLRQLFVPLGVFSSRKNLQKVSSWLDFVWYWFSTK